MRGETKDLFAGLARPAGVPISLNQTLERSPGRVDHMAATRRLRVKLRRAQSHSPEEVKAGRLICRHLLAMLEEAQEEAQEEAELDEATPRRVPENDSVYALGQAAGR